MGVQSAATGRTLNRGLTLPVLAIGAASAKMGLEFEGAMTEIRALVGASDKQMAGYREGVLELAKVTPQGPQALAEALYFVTSAGFEGAAAMDVLEASAKAAAAGLGDTTTVADAVTSAVNAYGETNLTAAAATDVLLATVREGKAEPEELAAAIGRVIAPAEAMGVTFGEVGGTVAALTLGGLDAAEAVTGLRGVLGTLLKPSEKAREVLEDAGMSIGGIRRQVDKNGLLPTLQLLRDRFGQNKDALGKLFPNVRALNAFLALTGRNAKKNAEAMKSVRDSLGDTDRAFEKAGEDSTKKFMTAWSNLQVMLIEASPPIIAAFTDIIEFVSMIAEKFNDLSPSTRKMIVGFALVAAAIGPILVSIGALIALIGVLISPVGAVILILAALGLGFVALWTKSERFRELVGSAWAWIQGKAEQFRAWFDGTLRPALENVLTAITEAWRLFGDDIKAVAGAAFNALLAIVRPILNTLKGYVELFLAVLRGDWSAAWSALKGIVRSQLQTAVAVFTAFPKIFFEAAKRVGSRIKDGIGAGIGDLAGWLGGIIRGAVNAVIDMVRGFGIPGFSIDPAGKFGPTISFGGLHPFSGIPHLALGADDFMGGLALVGERGPELVNLPGGTDVYPARQTRAMLDGPNLEGLRIAGTLDLDTGKLDGIVVGHLDERDRTARRRRRQGGGS